MPTLLTRAEGSPSSEALCNFSQPAQTLLVEQQVPMEELKERCKRYLDYLTALQPSQENLMIRAANFTTESVLQMIQQSPGSDFIRVYYGIDANGVHGLFMAPVTQAGSFTTSTADLTYVDDCCACPPKDNCPEDELLSW